ncbi:hypothetical protein ACFQ77_01625 [Streptomyces virginiae]|uniref:hypothetical protein n=1 Tax=Streptomyces virginiae TaxID=1961 RepID=UPI0036C4D9AB
MKVRRARCSVVRQACRAVLEVAGGLDAAFASLRRPEEHIEVLIRPGLAGAGVGVSSV